MRDLRDPKALGALLLEMARLKRVNHTVYGRGESLSETYDALPQMMGVAKYDATGDIRPRVESGAAH